MALFGLSPLILSLLASKWFMFPQRGLDVANYTAFLAVLTAIIHIIGAINLRVDSPIQQQNSADDDSSGVEPSNGEVTSDSDETSALLPQKIDLGNYDSFWDILRDPHFWILALITLLVLGSCEMVMANIGTIALALPTTQGTEITAGPFANSTTVTSVATTQVRLLSFSNTISRITTGPMADFISPVASYLRPGLLVLPRQHKISRVVFLFGSCLLMTISFLWMVFVIQVQEQIWLFSVGIGTAYGSTFTVL
ncbi:hypothetical protein Clacol_006307 [Clathrus columnatus]|uniref:Uncharacterized protein n=1 Tax=Clathrus columnatus TaxID=1419009 RepID=A0AAV5AHV2_9AGAM|nr:hypothetical protein Clacol_006307 [Clathrus columnatus]